MNRHEDHQIPTEEGETEQEARFSRTHANKVRTERTGASARERKGPSLRLTRGARTGASVVHEAGRRTTTDQRTFGPNNRRARDPYSRTRTNGAACDRTEPHQTPHPRSDPDPRRAHTTRTTGDVRRAWYGSAAVQRAQGTSRAHHEEICYGTPMKPLLVLIRFYQAVSRVLVSQGALSPISGCRQWPTCSDYAVNAIQTRGAVRGTLLAIRRFSRCGPWIAATSHVH